MFTVYRLWASAASGFMWTNRTKASEVTKSAQNVQAHGQFALNTYADSLLSAALPFRPACSATFQLFQRLQVAKIQALSHGQLLGQSHKLFGLRRHVLACVSLHHYIYSFEPSYFTVLLPFSCGLLLLLLLMYFSSYFRKLDMLSCGWNSLCAFVCVPASRVREV